MNNDPYDVPEFYDYDDDYLDDEDSYDGYFVDEPAPVDPDWHRADSRWELPWYQSWLILLVLIIIYLSWTGLIYWIEPGIR